MSVKDQTISSTTYSINCSLTLPKIYKHTPRIFHEFLTNKYKCKRDANILYRKNEPDEELARNVNVLLLETPVCT